jgi:hypothetical protein
MTIILFVACRNRAKKTEEGKKEEDKKSLELDQINGQAVVAKEKKSQQMMSATKSNGISIIIYSSEIGLQT